MYLLDPAVVLLSICPLAAQAPYANAASGFVSGMTVTADPKIGGSGLLFILSIFISFFKALILAA
jgi:hypothetical protein